ncbi:MAG: family 43 glycosylhydrolase, partial [Armatimonadota bacterium]|nr:family 43 glycosylhydrolase [Armatimonadota bacterium]
MKKHTMKQRHLFPLLMIAGLLVLARNVCPADTLAYWRFEEGTAGQQSGVGPAVASDTSGAGNALAIAIPEAQTIYTADVPFPVVPQTGAKNALSCRFSFTSDFYTRDQKINTYNFSPTGSNAWTLELSFKMAGLDGVNRLCGRDGNTSDQEKRGPVQILTTDTDGDGKFDIRAEILDGSNTFQTVASDAVYTAGRWYNVAATANSTTLNLYVDQLDGKGYQLVGTQTINGALNATTGAFAIGRGWNGEPTDWINGQIDEVRVSDVALKAEQFLFVSPATGPVTAPAATQAAATVVPTKIALFMGADPHAAVFGDRYWLYPTGHGFGPRNQAFFAFSSPDRKTWIRHGPIFQFKDAPWIYAAGDYNRWAWAPSIVSKDGKYYFYYSVGPQGRLPASIGVAVGDSPAGPFRDKGEALLTGGQGFEAIDPLVFHDPVSGKHYLYAGGSNGAKLRVFELAPDMISLAREIPVETPRNFTEGPFMHYRNGIYYLSYSHGWWRGASYSVHYATAKTPVGPWQYRGPILVSDATRKGPGHHSFVQDPKSGEWFIVYHRWQHPAGGNPLKAPVGRSLAIERISYGPNGEILPVTMTDTGLPQLVEPSPMTGRSGLLKDKPEKRKAKTNERQPKTKGSVRTVIARERVATVAIFPNATTLQL